MTLKMCHFDTVCHLKSDRKWILTILQPRWSSSTKKQLLWAVNMRFVANSQKLAKSDNILQSSHKHINRMTFISRHSVV